jgi:hypothetical protein
MVISLQRVKTAQSTPPFAVGSAGKGNEKHSEVRL